MSFTKEYYFKETLTKQTILKETLKSFEFENCEFVGCSFVEGKFQKCKFLECKFFDCILSATNLVESRFRDVKFSKSKVIGIDWTKTAELSDLAFNECQINFSNFSMLKIPETKIVHCEAKEVDFTETDLQKSDFQNTDFEKSRFFKTNLSYTNLRGAINYNIDINNNIIKQARFSLPEALSLLRSLDVLLE